MMETALTRRVINANYRLGTAECAARLAAIAANPALADVARLDAFEALAQWPVKPGRDRVLGIVVEGEGGDVGPDLAEVGKKMGREYVLRSIVDPNAVIAKGYDNVMVTLKNGEIVAGLLSAETADEIALKNPADAKLQRVKKANVKERASLPSAMPPGLGDILGKRALRDRGAVSFHAEVAGCLGAAASVSATPPLDGISGGGD